VAVLPFTQLATIVDAEPFYIGSCLCKGGRRASQGDRRNDAKVQETGSSMLLTHRQLSDSRYPVAAPGLPSPLKGFPRRWDMSYHGSISME
jgi:hypothetical protein